MNTYLDCFPCFLRQAIEASKMVTDDEVVHRRVLNAVMEKLFTFPLAATPPEMATLIHQTIRKATGSDDPYRVVKKVLARELGVDVNDMVFMNRDRSRLQ